MSADKVTVCAQAQGPPEECDLSVQHCAKKVLAKLRFKERGGVRSEHLSLYITAHVPKN